MKASKRQTVEPIRDIEKVKEIEQTLNPTYSLIWKIGTNIGLRVSDILNLDCNIVGADYVRIFEQKTGKYKKFPVNEDLKNAIKHYYNNVRAKDNDQHLFLNSKGNVLNRKQVYRAIVEAVKRVGVNVNAGTHTMRKTFGYHHYKQFKDIVILQKIFNHSAAHITLRYIGIEQEQIEESYNCFKLNGKRQETDLEQSIRRIVREELENRGEGERIIIELKNYIANGGKYTNFAKDLLRLA